jgi:hypothetical protein
LSRARPEGSIPNRLNSLSSALARLSPLLDQICRHSQIQNQTTGYSNQY